MTQDIYKMINKYKSNYNINKNSIGKTIIGSGVLDLLISGKIYIENQHVDSIPYGVVIGVGLIGYGIKTLHSGSKLVDKITKQDLGYNLEEKIYKNK